MSRKVEEYFPITLAILVTSIAWYFNINIVSTSKFEQILNAVINICAILIGFLGTMVSILIVASGRKVMRLLTKCNCLKLFNSYFMKAIVSGLLGAVFSVILIGLMSKEHICVQYLSYIWLYLATYFLFAAARVLYNMLQILASIVEENNR